MTQFDLSPCPSPKTPVFSRPFAIPPPLSLSLSRRSAVLSAVDRLLFCDTFRPPVIDVTCPFFFFRSETTLRYEPLFPPSVVPLTSAFPPRADTYAQSDVVLTRTALKKGTTGTATDSNKGRRKWEYVGGAKSATMHEPPSPRRPVSQSGDIWMPNRSRSFSPPCLCHPLLLSFSLFLTAANLSYPSGANNRDKSRV